MAICCCMSTLRSSPAWRMRVSGSSMPACSSTQVLGTMPAPCSCSPATIFSCVFDPIMAPKLTLLRHQPPRWAGRQAAGVAACIHDYGWGNRTHLEGLGEGGGVLDHHLGVGGLDDGVLHDQLHHLQVAVLVEDVGDVALAQTAHHLVVQPLG